MSIDMVKLGCSISSEKGPRYKLFFSPKSFDFTYVQLYILIPVDFEKSIDCIVDLNYRITLLKLNSAYIFGILNFER